MCYAARRDVRQPGRSRWRLAPEDARLKARWRDKPLLLHWRGQGVSLGWGLRDAMREGTGTLAGGLCRAETRRRSGRVAKRLFRDPYFDLLQRDPYAMWAENVLGPVTA